MKWGKKLVIALTAALLMLSTSALADSLRFGTVDNGSSVNLREGASTKTQRIGSYERGTWLRIISETDGWYRVVGPDGKIGYVEN